MDELGTNRTDVVAHNLYKFWKSTILFSEPADAVMNRI